MSQHTRAYHEQRWDSDIIPRFTKIFEFLQNFKVIVLSVKNNAFLQNLSPWTRFGVEKSHEKFQNLRMGQVPFKIIFLKNCLYHRVERSKEQVFTQDHEKRPLNSSVFRILKFSFIENWRPSDFRELKI